MLYRLQVDGFVVAGAVDGGVIVESLLDASFSNLTPEADAAENSCQNSCPFPPKAATKKLVRPSSSGTTPSVAPSPSVEQERSLVCGQPEELLQGSGTVKRCEQVD